MFGCNRRIEDTRRNGRIYCHDEQYSFKWIVDFDPLGLENTYMSKISSPAFNFELQAPHVYSCCLTLESKQIELNNNVEDYLTLQVSLKREPSKIEAKLSRIYVEIKIVNMFDIDKTIIVKNPQYINCYPSEYVDNFYFDNFVKKQTISEEKGFLIEGHLIVEFKLRFSQGMKTLEFDEAADARNIKSGISHDLEQLFESGALSDIKFIVEGKELHAHKCILAARSPVFSAMFQHNMKENIENNVHVNDVSYEVMKELFLFVYAERLDNLKKHVCDLLAAANKYELDGLKRVCEKELINNLNCDNFVDVFDLAEHYNADTLREAVVRFVSSNAMEILSLDKFKNGVDYQLPVPLNKELFTTLLSKVKKESKNKLM